MLEIRQTMDWSRWENFTRMLRSDVEGTTDGPFRQALRSAALIYLDVMQERFIRFSRGGGDWPPLSPTTIARRLRRGVRNPRRILKNPRRLNEMNSNILFDTQTLYRSLTPTYPASQPGQILEDIPNGMRVGIGGQAIHPATSNIRVGDIARWQHFGTRKIPPRPILVVPTTEAEQRIRNRLQAGLDELVATVASMT